MFELVDQQVHERDCNFTAEVLCRISCDKDSTRYDDVCYSSAGSVSQSPYGYKGAALQCGSKGLPYVHNQAENEYLRGTSANLDCVAQD